MKYCFHCGQELLQEAAFCSNCGQSLTPQASSQVPPAKPRMDGGTRGKGIASLVLGIEGLCLSAAGLFFLLFQFLFTIVLPGEAAMVGMFLVVYVVIFGGIGLGSGIAGRLLGQKALEKAPCYKLPKAGVPLSLAALIGGAVDLGLGFLFLFIPFL